MPAVVYLDAATQQLQVPHCEVPVRMLHSIVRLKLKEPALIWRRSPGRRSTRALLEFLQRTSGADRPVVVAETVEPDQRQAECMLF